MRVILILIYVRALLLFALLKLVHAPLAIHLDKKNYGPKRIQPIVTFIPRSAIFTKFYQANSNEAH